MGLFSPSKYNDAEKDLLNLYTHILSTTMGFSESEARKTTESMLDQSIEESKKSGSYYLPQNFGDILLGNANSEDTTIKRHTEIIKEKTKKKKDDGVRDDDIRWWWNLNDVERRIMLKQDEMNRLALFIHELKEGKADTKEELEEKAMDKVRKFHPMYGDSNDTTHTKGDDRPLPWELKDRINIYIEKRYQGDKEAHKKDIEESTTFNALVRKEIRENNL